MEQKIINTGVALATGGVLITIGNIYGKNEEIFGIKPDAQKKIAKASVLFGLGLVCIGFAITIKK